MSFPPLDAQQIRLASAALARGDLIGMPTETVYGLGGDATNGLAVARIYEAKGRPRFNPLISHIANLDAAMNQGVFSPLALKLARAFWPGPLTLVVPRHSTTTICDLACAGLDTVALRVPDHTLTLALLEAFGRPVAAPSANISGRPSPTSPYHVEAELGDRVALVLRGGASQVGIESAVVSVIDDKATLLRLGGLGRADIEAVAGPLLTPHQSALSAPPSPGMVLRHYAPNAPVKLEQTKSGSGEILIGFGPIFDDAAFNLSKNGDVAEAAANLFSFLRAADALSPTAINIAPIPAHGLGEAINDRLTRAAQG